MSDIPCEGRDEEACETPPFPGNQTCVFEDKKCTPINVDHTNGEYVVTIPADVKTISDKSTFIESSIVNGVCGRAVLGLLENAKLDGVAILPNAATAPAPAADASPAPGTAAGTVRTIEVKKKSPIQLEQLEQCPESKTCPEKPMTKEQLAILLSLFAQIKTLNRNFKAPPEEILNRFNESNAEGDISWYRYILDELTKHGSETNPGDEKVKYTVKFVDDDEGSTSDGLAESIIQKIAGCSDGAGGGKRKRSRRGKKQKKSKRSTRKKRKRKSKKNNIGIN